VSRASGPPPFPHLWRNLVCKPAFDPRFRQRCECRSESGGTTGPTGDRVRAPDRIAEILRRYPPEHPVHRAVTAARGDLIASATRATRATRRLGLPDEGFTTV
jgi:hypothetical protein